MSKFNKERKKKIQKRLKNETGNFIIKTESPGGETIFYAPDPIVSWAKGKDSAHRMPKDLAEIMQEYFDKTFPDDKHEIIDLRSGMTETEKEISDEEQRTIREQQHRDEHNM